MEDNVPKGRFAKISRIKTYSVITLFRKLGPRVYFMVESTKNPGNQFQILGLDLVESTDEEKDVFLNELRLFASIDHPLILRYHECFVDKKNAILW